MHTPNRAFGGADDPTSRIVPPAPLLLVLVAVGEVEEDDEVAVGSEEPSGLACEVELELTASVIDEVSAMIEVVLDDGSDVVGEDEVSEVDSSSEDVVVVTGVSVCAWTVVEAFLDELDALTLEVRENSDSLSSSSELSFFESSSPLFS